MADHLSTPCSLSQTEYGRPSVLLSDPNLPETPSYTAQQPGHLYSPTKGV